MTRAQIFSANFTSEPWWWRDFTPPDDPPSDLPSEVSTLVIGAGYAGISCALRLAESGDDVVVLDADRLGFNSSSRSGGQVTGGVSVGKSLFRQEIPPARRAALLRDASKGLVLFEKLVIRHKIDCDYHPTGRLVGFWTSSHKNAWKRMVEDLNEFADSRARLVGRDEAAAEAGSDFYCGGMIIERAGHIQPARYFGGLLSAARSAGARCYGMTTVRTIERRADGHFRISTSRGEIRADRVVLATNAYTGTHSPQLARALRRTLIPVSTQMIATEALPESLARAIIPRDRGISESRRVLAHYRKSPDGRVLLFGGRATFFPLSIHKTSTLLYSAMVARFPLLKGITITNGWSGRVAMTFDRFPHIGGSNGWYFTAGCQGSGITTMTYLGTSLAEKILSDSEDPVNAFDTGLPPQHQFYNGKPWFMPLVGSWYQLQDYWDRRLDAK